MNCNERIRRSILIENMKKYSDAATRLGLKDISKFRSIKKKERTSRGYSMK